MRHSITFPLAGFKPITSTPEVRVGISCRYSTRVKLGITLIVLVILNSNLRQLRSTVSSFGALAQIDDISQYEQRFIGVKQFLPANQFVAYRDEFDKVSQQCDAFFLAQYALAPTVLVAFDSECRSSDQVVARKSRLVLDNFHDPRNEPYLLRLFPSNYFQPQFHPASTGRDQLYDADDVVLFDEPDLGLKLYGTGHK
jgi:hypothetical protein